MVEIKGSAVRDAVAVYRERLPDECRQVLDALDPATRTVITEAQPNEWVPLDAFIRYLQAQVDVTGEDPWKLHTDRAAIVVERQLHGIYKVFAKLSSPQALVSRLAAIDSTYWRGITMERRAVSPTRVIVRYTGFEKGHRLIEPIIAGFFRKVLEVNGARSIAAEFTAHVGAGDHAELAVSWE